MEAGGRDPSHPLTTAEEEEAAVKGRTDCIYFLASPLTCKKGNECEYRHSEGARINPRDCWYWLNGNCLNPKCSFRHPPLDGLLGTPTATPSEPSLPRSQTVSTQIPAANAPAATTANKQAIPCYYFQKGGCLKGDRCPFMHGVQPIVNHSPQQATKVAIPVIGSTHSFQKTSWGLEKCTSQQNVSNISVDKPVEVVKSSAKSVPKEELRLHNRLASKSNVLPGPLVSKIPSISLRDNIHISSNSAPVRSRGRLSQPSDKHLQNGREADEFLKESSPGFDVLVDDEPKDLDYFHKKDKFGGTSGYSGGDLKPANNLDHHHSSDNASVDKFKREPYVEVGEFDRYVRTHDQHGWENQRRSSERIMERSSMPERRRILREGSPAGIDGSDLRHRLLKQRRLNGLRLAVSPDRRGPYQRDDRHGEEQRYHSHSSQRVQEHISHESSISNRLRGRITLPGTSSSNNFSDLHSGEDRVRGRKGVRSSSPVRLVNVQVRHSDRTKQRVNENAVEEQKLVGQPIRRDDIVILDFAGPKSLAELKGVKVSNSSEDKSFELGNATLTQEQKNTRLGKALGYEEFASSLPFESPKPLSIILKRKREAAPGNDTVSGTAHENNQRDEGGPRGGSTIAAGTNNQVLQLGSEKESSKVNPVLSNIDEPKARTADKEEEEGLILTDGEELPHEDQSSPKGEMLETEDSMMVDDMEDPGFENYEENDGLENYEENDGEYEYEEVEGEDFKAEDDENAYQEYDGELDGEEGFDKKLDAMFS